MEETVTNGGFWFLFRWRLRPALATVLLLLLSTLSTLPSEAKSRKAASNVERASALGDAASVAGNATGVSPKQRVVSFTFKQLGALTPIRLRGVEGSVSFPFSIRSDEV